MPGSARYGNPRATTYNDDFPPRGVTIPLASGSASAIFFHETDLTNVLAPQYTPLPNSDLRDMVAQQPTHGEYSYVGALNLTCVRPLSSPSIKENFSQSTFMIMCINNAWENKKIC